MLLSFKGFYAMENDPFRDCQPKKVTFNLFTLSTLNTILLVQTL